MPEDIAGRLYPFRFARRRWRAAGKWLSGFIKQGVCQVLEWLPWRVRCAYPPYKGDMVKSGGFAPAKKNRPNGAIFRREPGLQRGRRRAPFARSREGSVHIKVRLWRTEHVHRSCIYIPQPEGKSVILMVGALRLPTLRSCDETARPIF